MKVKDLEPIIYLGYNRNGTTWLGNVLSTRFKIATAKHFVHYGIHYCAIYDHLKYWQDFSKLDNYMRFLEAFASSDFFKLCEGDKEWFYKNPQTDFYSFFFELMDQFCLKTDSKYWTTKIQLDLFTNKKALEQFELALNSRYNNIHYISIQRNFDQYSKSVSNLGEKDFQKRRGTLQQVFLKFSSTARYYNYYRKLMNFKKNHNVLTLHFDDLKTNFEESLVKIKNHLNYESEIIEKPENKVVKNTSFQKDKIKVKNQKIFTRLLKTIFSKSALLNNIAIDILEFRRRNFIHKKEPIYRRLLKLEFFKEDLIREFQETNNDHLADEIKNY